MSMSSLKLRRLISYYLHSYYLIYICLAQKITLSTVLSSSKSLRLNIPMKSPNSIPDISFIQWRFISISENSETNFPLFLRSNNMFLIMRLIKHGQLGLRNGFSHFFSEHINVSLHIYSQSMIL